MKNSRENIIAAIEFDTPDRLPLTFDAFNVSDVHNVSWNQIGTGDHNQSLTFDEWNCGWSRSDVKNMGLVTEHPLDDWEKLDSFQWPDPDNPDFYKGMNDRFENSDNKYIMTSLFMVLFERLHSLRGFENLLSDLYLEKEKIAELADRVVEFDIKIIENIAALFPDKIDGIMFSDDWGTEQNLIINPELWEEFFQHRYSKIFSACKKAGWHVWLHSCGRINKIVDNLIHLGVDVLNLQQPTLLGIEDFGKQFAGKVCFHSLCDIQKTLPFKNKQEITEEAHLLLKHWGTDKGGFILGDYGDGEAIGVPLYKKRIMFDAFNEADRWKKTVE